MSFPFTWKYFILHQFFNQKLEVETKMFKLKKIHVNLLLNTKTIKSKFLPRWSNVLSVWVILPSKISAHAYFHSPEILTKNTLTKDYFTKTMFALGLLFQIQLFVFGIRALISNHFMGLEIFQTFFAVVDYCNSSKMFYLLLFRMLKVCLLKSSKYEFPKFHSKEFHNFLKRFLLRFRRFCIACKKTHLNFGSFSVLKL